jgi:dTDP-glucose 4,6-dehydratase
MKKTVLITGGTGFLGFHLIKACLKKNFKVTSIATSRPKRIRFLKKTKYIVCKLENKKKLKNIIRSKFDYVINFAGHVDHQNRKKTYLSHYIGCKNLCEILIEKKFKPKLFIQIGSSLEYGKLKSPHNEKMKTMKKKLTNAYGLSKFLATKYLINIIQKVKFPATILRLYQVYGTHQDSNRLIPIVINNCLNNKKFPCSNGKQMRDFIYVDDVIKAILKTFKSKEAIGEIINIGYGKTQRVKNIINLIKKELKGGKPLFGKIKLRADEVINFKPDIQKAKKILGWKPNIKFKDGLKKTINYYKGSYKQT